MSWPFAKDLRGSIEHGAWSMEHREIQLAAGSGQEELGTKD